MVLNKAHHSRITKESFSKLPTKFMFYPLPTPKKLGCGYSDGFTHTVALVLYVLLL